MPSRFIAASLLTFSILSSFIFCVIYVAMLYFGMAELWIIVLLTVGTNAVLLFIGPWLTDHLSRWFYHTKFMTEAEVAQSYPEMAALIRSVSSEFKFPFPKIGIIDDNNPTAFTYGSGRYNARLVVTKGIFLFLKPAEVNAVVAHELGHIVNRDFLVMMIASTIVQILYEIYAVLIRVRGRKTGGLKLVALLSYVFYVIGTYLLLFLSRTREYMADAFSASRTSPEDLAHALVKIAYGIVSVDDSEVSKRLLESTRHLGIIDVKNAKHVGMTAFIAQQQSEVVAEAMVFDAVSPWAKLIEIHSTHPLTGKRIQTLSNISQQLGKPFSYDVNAAIKRLNIDNTRLYSGFLFGLFMSAAPWIGALVAVFVFPIPFVLTGVALGLLVQIPYKYPVGTPIATTVLDQLRNPYASPLHGQPIQLQGKIVGRGVPGYIFSEDMMFQDNTGLTFVDYSSKFGAIGNLFFAVGKIKTLFNTPAKVVGWYYRGMSSLVSLRYLQTETETVRSHPILWTVVLSICMIVLSFGIYFWVITN